MASLKYEDDKIKVSGEAPDVLKAIRTKYIFGLLLKLLGFTACGGVLVKLVIHFYKQ